MRDVIWTSLLAAMLMPAPARAQGPIIAESLSSLGRMETMPTAQVVATGGMITFGQGTADDAARNPATLLQGAKEDVILSIAGQRVFLDRFTRTDPPEAIFTGTQQHAVIAGPLARGGFAAAALRRDRWALGGFYDATSRFRHDFTTGARFVRGFSFLGASAPFSITTGSTTSSALVDRTRIGSAFAFRVGPASIGAAVGVERLEVAVQSLSSLRLTSGSILQPVSTTTFIEDDRLAGNAWKPAFSIGGAWQVLPAAGLSFVWQHPPTYETRLASNRFSVPTVMQVYVPELVAFGPRATFRALTAGAEIRFVDYGILRDYQLAAPDIGSHIHSTMWQSEARAGAQLRLPAGRSRILISGGIASETAAGLDWSASNSDVDQTRWRSAQPPVITRLSAGFGVETSQGDVSIAFSRASDEHRLVATFGRRFR